MSNAPGLPVLGETLATPIGYYSGMTDGAVATESAGTIYLFGGYPAEQRQLAGRDVELRDARRAVRLPRRLRQRTDSL